MNSCVGFVSSLACLNRSVMGLVGPQCRSPSIESRNSFVLWSDGMADSGQLSCTCPWPSVPVGQILLSIPTARKHLKAHASLWIGWPHRPDRQESTLLLIYKVTASKTMILGSSPSVPIQCDSVWPRGSL